jgi:hypothetical protein
MSSYRYSLAFTAYSLAARTLTHTPAYTGPTFSLLSTIFELLLDPTVHSYWSQKGDCAPLFLTTYCEEHDTSMCDLNILWHGADAIQCPDPVYFGNIMYSAHLAHVGALVKLFAPSPAAASQVLDNFFINNTPYSFDSLLDRLRYQAISQADVLGGGITCEPGNVYPSCQSHLHAALRLVDAIDGAATDDSGGSAKIRQTWQNYLFEDNIAKGWDTPLGDTKFGDRMFQIAQQTPRHPNFPDFEIPIGCSSHDVWVLAWMTPWVSDDLSASAPTSTSASASVPSPKHILSRGRYLLQHHPAWSGGSLEDQRCKLMAGEENWDVANSMYPVLEAQLARGAGGDGDLARSNEAIARFEAMSADVDVSNNTYHYVSTYGLDVLVTTQLATAMVVDGSTLADLHGPAGVEKVQREGEVYVDSVEGGVFVRRAHRRQGELTLTLVAKSDDESGEKFRVLVEGVKSVTGVFINGEKADSWVVGDDGVVSVEGVVGPEGDAVLDVTWW